MTRKVNLIWKKELKNSVPFVVKLNGTEVGVIKKESAIDFLVNGETIQLLFCPKAPKWFGWKALSVDAVMTNNNEITICLGVEYEIRRAGLGGLRRAGNPNNQLHIIEQKGLANYQEQHLKKW